MEGEKTFAEATQRMSEKVRNGKLKVEGIKIDKQQLAKHGHLLLKDEEEVKLSLPAKTRKLKRQKSIFYRTMIRALGRLELFQRRWQTKN